MSDVAGQGGIESGEGRTLRVVVVNGTDPLAEPRGGTSAYIRGLERALSSKGIDVWNVCVSSGGRAPAANEIVVANRPITNYSFIFRLFFGRRRVRRVLRKRSSIIHANRPDQLAPFMFIGRKPGLVCTIHGPVRSAMKSLRSRPTSALYSLLEIIGLRIADALIFVNKAAYDEYMERFPKLKRKSHVISSGIPPEFFRIEFSQSEAKKRMGLGERDTVISFVGRLEPEKNVDTIIRAFSKIHSEDAGVRLLIAGDGSLRGDLERRASELDLGGSVKFLGRVPHSDVMTLMRASKTLIMASKWEGAPTVAREALAVGAMLVSTNVGDIAELLVDGRYGRIIEGDSVDAVYKAMAESLKAQRPEAPPNEIAQMDWEIIGGRTLDLYRSLL